MSFRLLTKWICLFKLNRCDSLQEINTWISSVDVDGSQFWKGCILYRIKYNNQWLLWWLLVMGKKTRFWEDIWIINFSWRFVFIDCLGSAIHKLPQWIKSCFRKNLWLLRCSALYSSQKNFYSIRHIEYSDTCMEH